METFLIIWAVVAAVWYLSLPPPCRSCKKRKRPLHSRSRKCVECTVEEIVGLPEVRRAMEQLGDIVRGPLPPGLVNRSPLSIERHDTPQQVFTLRNVTGGIVAGGARGLILGERGGEAFIPLQRKPTNNFCCAVCTTEFQAATDEAQCEICGEHCLPVFKKLEKTANKEEKIIQEPKQKIRRKLNLEE